MKQIIASRNKRKRIVWTDEDPLLKEGNSIRFKNQEEFWNIDKVFSTQHDKLEINRSWHVGGL